MSEVFEMFKKMVVEADAPPEEKLKTLSRLASMRIVDLLSEEEKKVWTEKVEELMKHKTIRELTEEMDSLAKREKEVKESLLVMQEKIGCLLKAEEMIRSRREDFHRNDRERKMLTDEIREHSNCILSLKNELEIIPHRRNNLEKNLREFKKILKKY